MANSWSEHNGVAVDWSADTLPVWPCMEQLRLAINERILAVNAWQGLDEFSGALPTLDFVVTEAGTYFCADADGSGHGTHYAWYDGEILVDQYFTKIMSLMGRYCCQDLYLFPTSELLAWKMNEVDGYYLSLPTNTAWNYELMQLALLDPAMPAAVNDFGLRVNTFADSKVIKILQKMLNKMTVLSRDLLTTEMLVTWPDPTTFDLTGWLPQGLSSQVIYTIAPAHYAQYDKSYYDPIWDKMAADPCYAGILTAAKSLALLPIFSVVMPPSLFTTPEITQPDLNTIPLSPFEISSCVVTPHWFADFAILGGFIYQ